MERIKKIFCALFGHSHIYTGCFGYMSCARCGEMQGDTLGGAFKDELAVVMDHNCDYCFKNYKKLTLKDKIFIRFPFEKDEQGNYPIITKEMRSEKMKKALDAMQASSIRRQKRMDEIPTIWDDISSETLAWLKDQSEEFCLDLMRQAVEQDLPCAEFFNSKLPVTA